MKILMMSFLSVFLTVLPTKLDIEKPLQEPMVVYVSDIDEQAAIRFALQMDAAQSTGQSVIPIVIDSYGGSVYALLTMIDIVKALRVPVATIITGKAMSAGAVLFTCGAEGMRYMGPNATIMIHQVSSMLGGKSSDIVATAAEVDRLNKKLFSLMSKNVGKEDGYLLGLLHNRGNVDWYIEAEEAKTLGLTNFIGIPTLETKITINSVLTLKKEEPKTTKK